jgi:hypothetical protein
LDASDLITLSFYSYIRPIYQSLPHVLGILKDFVQSCINLLTLGKTENKKEPLCKATLLYGIAPHGSTSAAALSLLTFY